MGIFSEWRLEIHNMSICHHCTPPVQQDDEAHSTRTERMTRSLRFLQLHQARLLSIPAWLRDFNSSSLFAIFTRRLILTVSDDWSQAYLGLVNTTTDWHCINTAKQPGIVHRPAMNVSSNCWLKHFIMYLICLMFSTCLSLSLCLWTTFTTSHESPEETERCLRKKQIISYWNNCWI